MKFLKNKKPNKNKHKRLKAALARAKTEIKTLRQKLLDAAKKYKESIDKERIMVAEKRNHD